MKYFLFVACCFFLFSCTEKTKYYNLWGTNHTYYTIDYEYNRPLDKGIQDLFKKYYKSINTFDSTSIISLVNQNKAVQLDSIFINTFLKAQYISKITDGYFDITCAPIVNYWGFGYDKEHHEISIDSLLTFVGYEKIKLEEGKIRKDDPRVIINFSGVGDGCICDIIGGYFDELGVENYMIDVGGEILIKGKNKKDRKWSVGITKPDDNVKNQTIMEVLESDQRVGIATSGDYRNFYIKDGKKYAHTINPKTGYPASQNILSATVVYKDCLIADGLATAIMAMGTEEFAKHKQEFDFFEYLLILADSNGKYIVETSPGMNKYIRKDALLRLNSQ